MKNFINFIFKTANSKQQTANSKVALLTLFLLLLMSNTRLLAQTPNGGTNTEQAPNLPPSSDCGTSFLANAGPTGVLPPNYLPICTSPTATKYIRVAFHFILPEQQQHRKVDKNNFKTQL